MLVLAVGNYLKILNFNLELVALNMIALNIYFKFFFK